LVAAFFCFGGYGAYAAKAAGLGMQQFVCCKVLDVRALYIGTFFAVSEFCAVSRFRVVLVRDVTFYYVFLNLFLTVLIF
jgi:hypothetical protein